MPRPPADRRGGSSATSRSSLSTRRWRRPDRRGSPSRQHGVTAGLDELGENFYRELARDYRAKRDLLCTTLEQIGLAPYWPRGSYYVLADASALPGANSKEKAMYLLAQAGVASVPGEAFFSEGGRNLLRFCFAKTDSDLQEACRRLSRVQVAAVSR